MRKKVFGRKLSRSRKARRALIKSLIKALIVSGGISTTKAKAKTIQGQIDKLVTLAKKNDLSSRRKVLSFLGNDRELTDRLFLKIVPSFKDRKSGFTRLILLPRRKGDNAEMVRLEWTDKYVEIEEKEIADKTKKNSKKQMKEEKQVKNSVKKEPKKIAKKVE